MLMKPWTFTKSTSFEQRLLKEIKEQVVPWKCENNLLAKILVICRRIMIISKGVTFPNFPSTSVALVRHRYCTKAIGL